MVSAADAGCRSSAEAWNAGAITARMAVAMVMERCFIRGACLRLCHAGAVVSRFAFDFKAGALMASIRRDGMFDVLFCHAFV